MALEITERGREFVKTVEFAAGLLDVIVTGLKEKFDDEHLEAFAMEFIMLTLTDRLHDPDNPNGARDLRVSQRALGAN
jgi:hypothetical protein